MISSTVAEVREAFRAFRRINEEVRLPQKAAWRIARLLNKLKPEVLAFEEAQLKIYTDAGGQQGGGGIEIVAPEREEGEAAETWAARQQAHRDKLNALSAELRALNRNEVEIDYDPLPISLFDEDDKTLPEKRRLFSANDFADCGPFITGD